MPTRLDIAKPDIVKLFEQGPRVLRASTIDQALTDNRDGWRLAQHTGRKSFTDFLLSKTSLRQASFSFPQRAVSGYTWGRVPTLVALQGLLDDAFYSHYTAVQVHGLTEQVPKTVYITSERSASGSQNKREPLSQEDIDEAFQRGPRVSSNECVAGALRLVHLSGAHHAQSGVVTRGVNMGEEGVVELRVSDLERTLVDITVRPFYAGGVAEVMKAFANAHDREDLSVNRMAALLTQMNFVYPYHQAMGFYLERAGFRGSLLDIFRRMPMERDFYLAYQMRETDYIAPWRLHVPKGL